MKSELKFIITILSWYTLLTYFRHLGSLKIRYNCIVSVSGVRKLEDTNSKWVGQALIKGRSEVYVRDGSPVTFTCEISPLSVASPQSGAHGVFMTAKPKVRWLHDNKELLFEVSILFILFHDTSGIYYFDP